MHDNQSVQLLQGKSTSNEGPVANEGPNSSFGRDLLPEGMKSEFGPTPPPGRRTGRNGRRGQSKLVANETTSGSSKEVDEILSKLAASDINQALYTFKE